MAIILYEALPSANSERVKIALHEKGLAYERVRLNLAARDQKKAEFLRLNPYGKVPVLNDNGRVIFESCIINEYLDEQYPDPPLMPGDPYLRARGRVLVDYALNYLQDAYWVLRTEMWKTSSARDPAVLTAKRAELEGLLRYLDTALGEQDYFTGSFSLADINMWPRLGRLEEYRVLPSPLLPQLNRWLQAMKARASVASVLRENDSIRATP